MSVLEIVHLLSRATNQDKGCFTSTYTAAGSTSQIHSSVSPYGINSSVNFSSHTLHHRTDKRNPFTSILSPFFSSTPPRKLSNNCCRGMSSVNVVQCARRLAQQLTSIERCVCIYVPVVKYTTTSTSSAYVHRKSMNGDHHNYLFVDDIHFCQQWTDFIYFFTLF